MSTLLTFYEYPEFTWPAIYTTNPIERMNKELRKRLKPMNSLTNIEAAEKIIYLQALDYNEKYPRVKVYYKPKPSSRAFIPMDNLTTQTS